MARAEAKVAHQQRVLNDAHASFDQASTSFCQSTASYIEALDRYGDLLHGTTPTVGDVRDAGKDLADPRQSALNAAQSAVEANHQVVQAEADLADAKAELTSAKNTKNGKPASSATGEESEPTPPPTPEPLLPAATVNRVKAADSAFTSARAGISDHTPLARASQEFNAAAVALEMSWLQVFSEAGCLTDEQQQQAQTAVASYTATLQKSLSEAGYYHAEVDGVYGPATVEAVKGLQRAHDLPITGAPDKATQAALQTDLQKQGGAATQEAVANTAALQQTLKLAVSGTAPSTATGHPSSPRP